MSRAPTAPPTLCFTHAYWHGHFQDDRSVLGRTLQLNKHPFTVVGVAPPGFYGTLLFFSPSFFVPMVNQEQVDGQSFLNVRGSRSIYDSVFMAMGHLKAGVTPAQAVADLDGIGRIWKRPIPKMRTNCDSSWRGQDSMETSLPVPRRHSFWD